MLFEPAFYPLPFVGINNSRDKIEGKDLFDPLLVGVDVEGYAHSEQRVLSSNLATG